ncbi:hypothetical protein EOPP23_01065 [Endozoicomonas sp. OPT23]|uniref:hypothetical protein n=1 Tax=Endozoicomonas sp. OPT23 TaxID=2072845 RepID=UPI00129A5007|nr:hypothetical protein [Endozoicomonas sp. OPT23]MRI31582.1 hypothetical protein [Endozoicomonas sp. OPT23]
MNKDVYIREIEKRLRLMFRSSKEGSKTSDIERHRLEGFMSAAVFIGYANNKELSKLMNDIHIEVFGKSIEAKKAEQKAIWKNSAIDYSQYEIPTVERVNS